MSPKNEVEHRLLWELHVLTQRESRSVDLNVEEYRWMFYDGRIPPETVIDSLHALEGEGWLRIPSCAPSTLIRGIELIRFWPGPMLREREQAQTAEVR